MELTAEQKYLKALAEWLDIKTIPKNRIQEASREYLDQFREGKEKVDHIQFNGCDCSLPDPITGEMPLEKMKCGDVPSWTPEVGKLYKRCDGSISEVINIGENVIVYREIGFNYTKKQKGHCTSIGCFVDNNTPIAELEGLKVSDYAYSYINEWFIDNIDNGWIALAGEGFIDVDINGIVVDLSSRQLIWRTADRAERFGRGDA